MILVVLVLFVFDMPVLAQEEEPANPRYVVQPWETLTEIAVRFDLTVAALTSANQISNPNQLYAGDVLELPGVDWIDGLLDVQDVPVGETFRSFRRRYHLDADILGRVAGVVSPTQVYAGYPLMIPTGVGEDLDAARAAVSSGESLLSLAARTGANPWAVASANQLDGGWTGLSGDVLLLPGTNQPGPGELPSPLTIDTTQGNFVQGKATVIRIGAGGEPMTLKGSFIGYDLNFFTDQNDYVAIQGVHAMTEPGPYMLYLNGSVDEKNEFSFSQLVLVGAGGYERETLTVDPVYLDSEVDAAESAFIESLAQKATAEKIWSGIFVKPTPFEIHINSFYGTRRSYNGSEFNFFHSGLDFGGAAGDVICPGDGVVVFAGPLEIRGNAVLINHGWGIYTGYWHQSELYVQEGDVVSEGQVIGQIGNTGRSSGAHLHWEVWAGGVQVEPWDWLVEQFP
jgi:murein DD-endopeptidase MepM/ murein hydrolase activator NlpD